MYFDRDFPSLANVFASVGDDPGERLLAVEAAVNDVLLANELAMRMIVRNSLDVTLTATDDPPLRLGRRQALIAAALTTLDGELPPDVLERLERALALVIGPEAIIAARDVCGLDADQTRDITRWAATGLLAYARSARSPAPGGRPSATTRARRS